MAILGVGGAGVRAVDHMARGGIDRVKFAVLDTDARQLSNSSVGLKHALGCKLTRGLSAGGDPDLARAAAQAEREEIRHLWQGADLVMIVAGLGRGTGSGAAPVLAQTARESGALVLALAVMPFEFEGSRRGQQAAEALRQLKTAADAVICLPNQKLARLLDEKTGLEDAFSFVNELLAQGARGLWRLATQGGLIQVDFADLCRAVRGRQAESSFASFSATGPNRARDVVDRLLSSPLLDEGRLLSEADSVLISLAGGPGMSLKEVQSVMELLQRSCERAQVVMGAAVEPGFEDRLSVTVVASKRSSETVVHGDRLAVGDEAPAKDGILDGESEFGMAGGVRGGHGYGHGQGQPSTGRTQRFVAPAPELTHEGIENLLLKREGATPRDRKKAAKLRQGMLPLEVIPKGRFAKSEPTIHRGEDLDTPTYVRRGVVLN